jgi:hypothetical protein
MRGIGRPRQAVSSIVASLMLGTASAAVAQQVPEPPPPQPDTTTVVEPIATPDVPPSEPPAEGPVEQKGPEHVPPDASGIDLTTLETKDLDLLYFDPVQTYLTPYIARAYENALDWHEKRFQWQPWETTTMLLKDFSDYANAGARASPNNTVLIDVAPLSITMETFTPGERFFTIVNHEMAHVAQMDVWNRRDAFWRRFFHGKPMPIQEHPESIFYNFLVTPRVSTPRWYLEGGAVFFETWMSGGLGRGQGGYDEMVWRAKVRDNDKFYSPLGLESAGIAVDFQVGVNDYLYGTRFMSYLALKYGPDKFVEWQSRREGSKAFYAAQFKQVFGRRLDDVWNDWIAFEHEYQKASLAKLAQYPLTETVKLSPQGLGSISRGYVDAKTNSLIAAFRYPGTIGFIGRMDLATGKLTKLQEIKGMMLYKVTSVAFDPDARTAYYTEDNYAFRDLVAVNVDTGRKRMLLKDARIGDMVVNPADKSIWGIRHENGLATIVRIPPPYAGFNQIHTFKYGHIPFDLDISPDGTKLSASFGEINGTQTARVWNIDSLSPEGDPVEVARLDLPPSTPEGFIFAPDGKSLYGTSYYTGVSNVFRFEIETKKYDAVSNASTGFFRPMPQPDGSLIAYEYSGRGLQPVRFIPQVREDLGTVEFLGTKLVNERPELKQWGVGSPAKIDLDAMIIARSKYNSARRIKLAAMYPIVEGYKGSVSHGYFFHFEDPLQFRQINVDLSVSPFGQMPKGERFHAKLQYKTLNWNLRYFHNGADFYDIFGPVERSRKGNAFIAEYNKTTIYDPPRQLDLSATGAVFLGLEKLPTAQNVSSPKNIYSFEAAAKYTDTRKSLGGVDHEKGIAWRLIGGADHADGQSFPHVWGGIDYGVPLPLSNSSAWVYAQAGIAGGKSESPLGAYYFGSFRNNYVDDRPEKRYREMESLPGFEIDQVAARKFAKVTGEINLPPLRFAEVGTPAFFLTHARPALFGGTMLFSSPEGRSYRLHDVGVQVDLAFTVAMRLPMVFSFGVAKGFGDKDIDGRTEWLASLKIL